MSALLTPLGLSFLFLLLNMLALRAVLQVNRRPRGNYPERAPVPTLPAVAKLIDATSILGWEFEYARTTASEALDDRRQTMNFYLIVAGVLLSGALGILTQKNGLPQRTGTVLLWVLCGAGWLYFLQIIRLRQAWHESSMVMNQIKEFCIQHTRDGDPDTLRLAFRWDSQTLPAQDRPWTLFFLSALLIGFLNSVAFVTGAILIDVHAWQASLLAGILAGGLLFVFGCIFFWYHSWLYFAFLRAERRIESGTDTRTTVESVAPVI